MAGSGWPSHYCVVGLRSSDERPMLTANAVPSPHPRRFNAAGAGPPFLTDDPVPVDLHHYEFYIFGGASQSSIARHTSHG
jgi:hypothetical protein